MKVTALRLKVLLLIVCCFSLSFAQSRSEFFNEKPGKLSKLINEKQINSITSLKIRGIMNSDDLAYLTEFVNLEELDIEEIELTRAKEKKYNYIGNLDYLKLPQFYNVKNLIIPKTCSSIDISISLDNLTIPSVCRVKFSDDVKINNVHILHTNNEKKQATFDESPEEKNWLNRYVYLHNYESDYSPASKRVSIDTLYINSINQLQNISVSSFDPNFIVIVPQRKVILNKYPEQGMTFNGVDSIMDGAFMDSKIKHITIPSTIKKIPDFCFAGCKNLVSVTLGDSIDYIGKYALAGTSITEITLPKNLKHIWYNSFKNTNLQKCKLRNIIPAEVIMYNRYDDEDDWKESLSNTMIETPQGGYINYKNNYLWSMLSLYEKDSKRTYNIVIKKPGTILSYLPIESLATIDSLTITGFLYDTDIQVFGMCKSLKYIDLSKTIISESPKTIEDREREKESLHAIAQLLGVAADMAYNDQEISYSDFLSAKILSELTNTPSKVTEASGNCIIPYKSFKDLRNLETVILPTRAIKIGYEAFSGCTNLENVVFPPFIQTIGYEAFKDCVKMKINEFPSSINDIGFGAFKNCKSLNQKIDLSSCTFDGEFDIATFNGVPLKEIRLPNGIESITLSIRTGYSANENIDKNCIIYFPKSFKRLRTTFWECELHFATEESPSTDGGSYRYRGKNNIIYVPKDCITSYYSAFGDENSYKEE